MFFKIRKKWENYVNITEHNIEQKIQFLEKDNKVIQEKIDRLRQKNKFQNKQLNQQYKKLQKISQNFLGDAQSPERSKYNNKRTPSKYKKEKIKKKKVKKKLPPVKKNVENSPYNQDSPIVYKTKYKSKSKSKRPKSKKSIKYRKSKSKVRKDLYKEEFQKSNDSEDSDFDELLKLKSDYKKAPKK